MKRWVCLLIVVLIALTSSSALAHSGRTDSSGGHTDHSTGAYHYHHGYPAHQHSGGECPYDFNDRTGWSSGSSSGSTHGVSKTSSVYDIESINALERKLSKAEKQIQKHEDTIERHRKYRAWQEDYIATLWVILAISLVVLFFFILGFVRTRKKVELTAELLRLKKAKRLAESIKIAQEEVEQLKKTMIPDGLELTGDGLPKQKGAREFWGEGFTVYVNYGSSVYHSSHCRYARTAHPVNVASLSSSQAPCMLCHPSVPDLTWYIQYKKAEKIINDKHLK